MDSKQVRDRFLSSLHRFSKLKMHAVFDHSDLTKSEFFYLASIQAHSKRCPDSFGMSVGELAERAHVRTPAISRTLKSLEERGLIQRTVCPEDRRTTFVTVTEAGRASWQQNADRLNSFMNRVLDRMGPDEVEQLILLLDRMSAIIEEEQEAGQC